MSKKSGKTRPQSNSAISNLVVQDANSLNAFSAFSPSADHFAFLSLAIDKHRLRIYDCSTNKSVAEHTVDSARITALSWINIYTSDLDLAPPAKKKRRRRENQGDSPKIVVQVVALGLSTGSVLFFSPTHARVIQELVNPTGTSPIIALFSSDPSTIWTSSADRTIALWKDMQLAGCWKTDDRVPYTSLAAREVLDEDQGTELLIANHAIKVITLDSDPSSSDLQKALPNISFTGHASSVKTLIWDTSSASSTRFFSLAERDRFVYLWQLPEQSSQNGLLLASISLDSEAQSMAFKDQTLLTLSTSGKISVLPIPAEFTTPTTSKQKVPTIIPRTSISPPKTKTESAQVVGVAFLPQTEGVVRVARMIAGARPVFSTVRYMDELGAFVAEVTLDEISPSLISQTELKTANKRYAENESVVVSSGIQLGQDVEMDELQANQIEGELDVDLAELSLGQRLTALSGETTQQISSDDDDDDENDRRKGLHSTKPVSQQELSVVPANSLTRTLIQALHSSDSRLVETCLAHSDPTLIRNTVRKLPPQLAVPLINACVDRLGRGSRAANLKGRGAGASSQKGMSLIVWIKSVLAIHSAHLMNMPDLVSRLSALHATLTSRMAIQESLLSLSGRLDMVLSQIEMRSSTAPAPVAVPKGKSISKQKEVRHYIEGESDEDSDDPKMDGMDVDDSDGEGSIEDIDLGGDSEEDEDEESEEEEESEDEVAHPTMNGFIDDEALEASEDEDEDDFSE